MFRYPIYHQDDEYSCGAYCIKMILKYYHLDEDIQTIKQRSKVTPTGISVYGMIQCFKHYNIEAKAYQCDVLTLLKEAKLPCVLHLVAGDITHYVVLYKQTKRYLVIGDPASGIVKMDVTKLTSLFSGICICIEHAGRFDQQSLNKENSFIVFVLRHLKQNYYFVLKLTLNSIVITICSILSSSYFQSLIDSIDQMSYMAIVVFTFVFMMISLLKIMISYRRKHLEIVIQKYLNDQYVGKTVSKMQYLPIRYLQNDQDGVLLTKVNNLFMLSDFFIHLYSVIFMDFVLLIGLFVALAIYSLAALMIVLIFFSIMAICLYHYLKKLFDLNKQIINSQEIMNQGYLEYLKNVYNNHQFFVKGFMKEKINYLFDEYNYHVDLRNKQLNRLNSLSELAIQLLLYLVVLLACFYYQNQMITIGEIILFYLLISYMIEPLFNLINFVLEKDEAAILYQRYQQITPPKRIKKIKFKEKIKEIKFDHISYSYGYRRPIIEHLDLTITKSIYLQGATGAGKSTLLKLLMNYDELLKGKIYINGIELATIDQDCLYHKIVYLDKQPIFYHESLLFNLCLNSHNEKNMITLMRLFGLEELLNQLDLVLRVDGFPLSSGQSQIIMLIRSLLKKPDVLILDEALCNVDDHLLRVIIDYLVKLDIILIVVAHQTKLMKELFDCVIIEDGKIKKEDEWKLDK